MAHLDGVVKLNVKFIERLLEKESKKKTLRADYVEFLELALLFLGVKPKKKSFQVMFHPPGAMHHARWMSKAIYSLKIFLFRNEFSLTKNEMAGLMLVNVFLIRYYIKVWFQSSDPCSAARIDLQFVQEMIAYSKSDENMAKLILKKFSRHLWYLSEEVIGMAFFDENISNSVKAKMVEKLCLNEIETSTSTIDESSASSNDSAENEEEEVSESSGESEELEFSYEEVDDNLFGIDEADDDSDYEEESDVSIRQPDEFEECPHKVLVRVNEMIKTYTEKKISDFVTPMTIQFFERFQIPCKFLEKPISEWLTDPEYNESKEMVAKLKVTNDTAERGIQQMSKYNNILSKDEKTKQFILHVVNFYNQKHKSFNVKDLVKN